MTDVTTGAGLADIQVTSNATTAPVEQKSTETTAPITRREQRFAELESKPQETVVADTKPVEPAKALPTEADKANDTAREALKEKMRADAAEAKIKELTPKAEVLDKAPDINDQKTWGKSFQDKPNDLETFLKAHAEWAESQGEKRVIERQSQEKAAQAAEKLRVDVATRDNAARAKFKDYDAVISPIVPILASIPILKDFVTKNPMGSEVAYELGRNPAILQSMLQSNDIWTVGEQLISMAARLKAPKPVEFTKAPEPITPVGSREGAKVNLTNLASKDTAGYIAEMNKRELARKRAH